MKIKGNTLYRIDNKDFEKIKVLNKYLNLSNSKIGDFWRITKNKKFSSDESTYPLPWKDITYISKYNYEDEDIYILNKELYIPKLEQEITKLESLLNDKKYELKQRQEANLILEKKNIGKPTLTILPSTSEDIPGYATNFSDEE